MRSLQLSVIGIFVLLIGACATAPKTTAERQELIQNADATLQAMRARDADLQGLLNQSVGYAVFPSIGKGGLVVGGAYGRGVLYENGQPTGFVELNQGSIGAQIGAQTFSELIVFRSRGELERLKAGNFSIGGNVSAVALTSGAAATTRFVDNVAIFVLPRGGLMAELSVTGQQLNYRPMGG
jgi:lipid-binding SYLF domain-containing protein